MTQINTDGAQISGGIQIPHREHRAHGEKFILCVLFSSVRNFKIYVHLCLILKLPR